MEQFDIRSFYENAKTFREDVLEKAEELVNKAKLQELLEKKKKDEEMKKIILLILSIVGVIALVIAIAVAVNKLQHPDYLEEYDDEDEEFALEEKEE